MANLGELESPWTPGSQGWKVPRGFPMPMALECGSGSKSWTSNKGGRIKRAQLKERALFVSQLWDSVATNSCPKLLPGPDILKMCCSCHKDAKKLMGLPFPCSDPKSETDHIGLQNPSSIGQCLELLTEPTSQDMGLFKGQDLSFQPQLLWCFCE